MPVWSEVELAYRLLDEPDRRRHRHQRQVHHHRADRRHAPRGPDGPVEVAGNVGRALTELPGRVAADAWIVCELSSFQLEDIDTFRARVGVVLNVTPDHLDRHGTMERYLALQAAAVREPDAPRTPRC